MSDPTWLRLGNETVELADVAGICKISTEL